MLAFPLLPLTVPFLLTLALSVFKSLWEQTITSILPATAPSLPPRSQDSGKSHLH